MHDQKAAPEKRKLSRGRVALGLVGACVLGAALILLVRERLGIPAYAALPAATTPIQLPPRDEALAALVAQEFARLGVKPKTAALPSDLALEAVAAVKRGDYSAAGGIAEDVLARSRLEGWHFYPFNKFIGNIGRGNDTVLLEHLNEWLRHDPKSAVAHLMRGAYYYQTAWNVRTAEVGWKIPSHLHQSFIDNLRLAGADAQASISLNPRVPWSYYLLLCAASANGNSPEAEHAFQVGIKAFPGYYELYRQRLWSLTPKWNGSIEEMNAFVTRYAGKAPDGSPLKLLYLQLYSNLLDAAWFECRSLESGALQKCVDTEMKQENIPSGVGDGVVKALKLYAASDPIQFSNAVWPVLSEMSWASKNSSSAVGAMLQVAASVMGSDNQLMDEPGHNSYVMDDVTAQVWVHMGNTSNAEQKFREALNDIEHTSFPDEARKAEALATVYDHMTDFARRTSQFMNVIVYYDAANAVGGINHGYVPHLKCYAYYKLKHFAEAASECTRVIQSNGNYLEPHFFLARSYQGLEQWDAALAEYTPVAESADNSLRVSAALEMSVIYGKKSDAAGELASLNRHAYLFDTDMQLPENLAASYNNRCYAYMKLGQLQKALDDCTTSLQHGKIPDAFHKQQKLMKLLAGKAKTL